MSIPFYCRRCQEMLGPRDEDCPFCGDSATPLDDLADEAMRQMAELGMQDYAHTVAVLRERAFAPRGNPLPNVRSAEV